jgi:hypothetical protein
MEAQRDYPIETFDPLLRDLVGWGLVTRQEGRTRTPWRLVTAAQRRLDELLPTVVPAGAVIYLDHLCADCRQRGPTRIHEESYVCDGCWKERQGRPDAVDAVVAGSPPLSPEISGADPGRDQRPPSSPDGQNSLLVSRLSERD